MEPLEFELHVPNDRRASRLVGGFAHQVVNTTALRDRERLADLVQAAADHLIDHAYLPGETGKIVIRAEMGPRWIAFRLRDFGLPRDVGKLEKEAQRHSNWAGRLPGIKAADQLHWKSYGPEGKELTIRKSIHDRHIKEHDRNLTPYADTVPQAPEQSYRIRRMRPEEAVVVSQAIYKAYGTTYTNPDVYYPDRIAAANASGSLISFVAEAENGDIVGHYALERNQPGPVAEGGQAVVAPEHRGRKLLDRMKSAALEHARELGLHGVYAEAVTLHVYTQKANVSYGGCLCSAELGVIPGSEKLRGIETPETTQRETLLIYFIPFVRQTPGALSVPDRHQELISRIYAGFGSAIEFARPTKPTGPGLFEVKTDARLATATITVESVGADSSSAIRRARRELVEQKHAETIILQLPISDPATARVAEAAEADGFVLAGIGPSFLPNDDTLRMIYLTEPVDPSKMNFYQPFAEELVRCACACCRF